MNLERPLATIDLETTGVDPMKDRVIEFAVAVLHPTGERTLWSQRFNPGMPIPAESTEMHGITDADVAECPPFSRYAHAIFNGLEGKDILGYNVRRLDLPVLDEELRRCRMALDLTGVRVLDAYSIYAKKEPRRLEDAVRRFCGREHSGAHGAAADALATLEVLLGQLAVFPDLAEMGVDQLAAFCAMDDVEYADLSGKLYRKGDDMFYSFGRYKDCLVASHLDFAHWMLTKDFPGSTKEALEDEIARLAEKDKQARQPVLGGQLAEALGKAGLVK